MTWTLLAGLVLVFGFSLLITLQRRSEVARMRRAVQAREAAARSGALAPKLSHPVIDLSQCLGCATCVAVCPEGDVLEIVHGQAVVVRGSSCQGVSACERECPTGAIRVTIANLADRDDVPVLDERLEAIGAPGVFLAGEVTAHALVRRAVQQGTRAARAAADHVAGQPRLERVHDLVVVGAGPAGLACTLEARRLGLATLTLDQEEAVGGTVAKYPRKKLVLTEPVELPGYGRLSRSSYSKEELMAIWADAAQRDGFIFRGGEAFVGLERDRNGVLVVRTQAGHAYGARSVVLALGRRGSPRRLDVPGEDRPHVAYSLIDAGSYARRRILVVGGGDSAIEAALGLSGQGNNDVVLSYRGAEFSRARTKNRARLARAIAERRLRVLTNSHVVRIEDRFAEIVVDAPEGRLEERVRTDDVFVMIGGIPPFELLRAAGVTFDPTARPIASDEPREQGRGFGRALALSFWLSLAVLLFALWHLDYYGLERAQRAQHPKHGLLRPGMGLGLAFGIASIVAIACNLAYLLRRSPSFRLRVGTLKAWMTSHVATGLFAVLLALLHAGMSPRDTVGGHAFLGLVFLLVTGAIGRYFYAFVPRAANGRELELEEVKADIVAGFAEGGKSEREFGERARDAVTELVDRRQWRSGFLGRVLALAGLRFDLARTLARLRREAKSEGIPEDKVRQVLALARRAHAAALSAAHYEDVRAILASWRYFHRWACALMLLLVVLHIVSALTYGGHLFEVLLR